MFHAALVTAVCLCVNPTSPEASEWTKDLDTTRASLTVELSNNKLARRCLEILDGLRPNTALDGGDLQSMFLQPEDIIRDFSFWSTNAADPFNVLGWSDFAQDFA